MGNGNKVEFLVAICALITSVAAIWVAWDQSRIMRAQQHAMVFPVLQTGGFVSTNEETIQIGVNLANSGVGPALIEAVIPMVNGEEIDSLEPYRSSLPPNYDISWAGIAGRAMAPGDELDAIRISWDRGDITTEHLNATVAKWSEIDLQFCYCSVFDQCWLTTDDNSRAKPVEACREQETDPFEAFGMNRMQPSAPISNEAP